MKYMNHLRKLALLSSLALSFSVAVHADGTLPLPLPIADGTLPLEMEDLDVNLKVAIKRMDLTTLPNNINGVEPCAKTEQLHFATGEVAHQGNALTLVGICKTKNESTKLNIVSRTVVAIPKGQTTADASAIVRMKGEVTLNLERNKFETFIGEMTTTAIGAVSSGLPEAGPPSPVPFEFIR